jgi:hypothetical protein
LAEQLGFANVDFMLAGMSSVQFSEWAAYYNVKQQKEEAERKAAKASAKAKRDNF